MAFTPTQSTGEPFLHQVGEIPGEIGTGETVLHPGCCLTIPAEAEGKPPPSDEPS